MALGQSIRVESISTKPLGASFTIVVVPRKRPAALISRPEPNKWATSHRARSALPYNKISAPLSTNIDRLTESLQ